MEKLSMFNMVNSNLFPLESETRPWGKWMILNEGPSYKVKLIEVNPGHRLSLQYHHHRTEHWLVVSGKARIVVANQVQELGVLQSTVIPERTVHRIENPMSEILRVIEVQLGSKLLEEDIVRLEDDYERELNSEGVE